MKVLDFNDRIKVSLMKHELEIHTEAVNAKMLHFYEVCSHIIALLSPVRPQTSDKQLSSLTTPVPLFSKAKR